MDGRAAPFADARVENVEGAGHWVHHDRLDEFLRIVREFLGREGGASVSAGGRS